jgi:lipid-A-disaccharide synthase-like uncharacterized protein
VTRDMFWLTLGFTAQALFSARFLVQWLQSERQRKSVVPLAFWYLSLAGGSALFAYALYRQDPVFILGQGAGVFIYLRNLILIGRERRAQLVPASADGQPLGTPQRPPRRWRSPSWLAASLDRLAGLAMALARRWHTLAWVALAGLVVLGLVIDHAAFWLLVGFLGQTLFSARFLVQWVQSERQGKSVIPLAFWYFSLGGGLLLFAYALYRQDPVFIVGQGSGVFIYLRNLVLIARERRSHGEMPLPDNIASPKER